MTDEEIENRVDPTPPTKKVKPVRRRSWFSRLLRKRSDAERQALALPTENRWERIFSMVVFFGLGALLTAFVVINPLGLAFLPQLSGGSSMTSLPLTNSGASHLDHCSNRGFAYHGFTLLERVLAKREILKA